MGYTRVLPHKFQAVFAQADPLYSSSFAYYAALQGSHIHKMQIAESIPNFLFMTIWQRGFRFVSFLFPLSLAAAPNLLPEHCQAEAFVMFLFGKAFSDKLQAGFI